MVGFKRTEGARQRLAGFIKDKYPDLPIFARRSEGIINCQFKQLTKLKVDHEKVGVSWNTKLCTEKEVDYKATESTFLVEGNIQWSSSS